MDGPISNRVPGTLSGAYLRALDHPRALLTLLGVLLLAALWFAGQFRFDASADTLVVRGDPDLAAYLEISGRFGGDEFLLLTFRPDSGGALDVDNLAVLERLQAELRAVEGVRTVFSILDAPLLASPPVAIAELRDGYRTLRSAEVDRQLAERELTRSPLFGELLITADARTTALRIELSLNAELLAVDQQRAELRARQHRLAATGGTLSAAERARLRELEAAHDRLREDYVAQRAALIGDVREIRDRYQPHGHLYLGGVPMIAADMIRFVQRDLLLFGSAAAALIVMMLFWFFRRLRWVVLPIAASVITVALTVGVLGALERPATVVSSNFVALVGIITISLTIHLTVRYRELLQQVPPMSQVELVRETMRSKFAPCLYNALTTIAAFGSLLASRIVPVEDFGWMMCLGIALAFFVIVTFFPAVLLLLPAGQPSRTLGRELALTRALSALARRRYRGVVVVAALWGVAAAVGISQVSTDNRFLEYFRQDTDIHQGMRYVDEHLGGTMPLEVVVRFAPYQDLAEGEQDDFFTEQENYPERYWFTRDKLDRVVRLHRFLEDRPEIGKVVSLASLDLVARSFNDGEALSSVELAGVLGALPEQLRADLVEPYASPATGQFRLNARIIETGPAFDRTALVDRIEAFARGELGFSDEDVRVTGMMVLFDSMLTQLFTSQVDTLVYVLAAVFVMFLVLLRSWMYAVIGLVPNILAAASVIAVMGYAGIPLDVMTITIASICVGIGVDDAIHYLHRFREEWARDHDVRRAVAASHATIGRAMYFTTLTVIVGFSVLVLSNFVPTLMFGLLTAAAMVLALVANLVLLPALLVLVLSARGERIAPREAPS